MNIYQLSIYGVWIINILVFALSGIDKLAAKSHKRRVPEKVLFGLSLLTGSLGMGLSMLLFHHKTGKPLFRIGVPLLVIVHFGLLSYGLLTLLQ